MSESSHRCTCGRRITEFIWVVRNVWFCGQECGARAAYVQANSNPQPTSQARYPETMASGS